MRAYSYAILFTLAWLGNSIPCNADIISGKPEPGAGTLWFSPYEIDVDGDGIIDIEISSRTLITNDEPSSASATNNTVRTRGSHLILSDRRQPRRFERIDRQDFPAPLGTAHWNNGRSTIGYSNGPHANVQVWDGGLRGFMLVLLEKADGYHPGWVQLNFGEVWNGEELVSPSPKIIDWHYDTDPIDIDPERVQPQFQPLEPPGAYEQRMRVDRLIKGHRYTIEWSPGLTADGWQVVQEFRATGTDHVVWWKHMKDPKRRFFRIRHDGPIPE